jgi:hypothetical protein
MQERWLDRVWQHLFGDNSSGLIAPGQIRREGLDRARVREAELDAIRTTERELEELRSGRKMVDQSGHMVDAIAVGDVPMHSIIERPPADEDAIFARLAKPEKLLGNVASEVNSRDLQRSLVIRRIALLAEQEVLAGASLQALPVRSIGAQWLERWRRLAQDVYLPELQRLWARALVREVVAPGHYSLAALDLLANVGEDELPGMQLLARYTFGEFLFDARERYFRPELHGAWLETAVSLGALQPLSPTRWLGLQVRPGEQEPLLLICHNRALQLSGLGKDGVRLPVLRVTAQGKQFFNLCGGEADMAYLLDLAAYLTNQRVHVALGEWLPQRRRFEKKFDFA